MTKTILITGSTDGIGLLTAQTLAKEGHTILLHGRGAARLEEAVTKVGGKVETYAADLSRMADIQTFAAEVTEKHDRLDERWSRKFGPAAKVDRMRKVTIQNEETKEPFARV